MLKFDVHLFFGYNTLIVIAFNADNHIRILNIIICFALNVLIIDDNPNTSGAIADYCDMNAIDRKGQQLQKWFMKFKT